MAFYVELSNNMNIILQLLTESQNLCKLLYYDTYDPLNETNLTQVERTSLINSKIYPMPNHSFAETEKTSRLCIYYSNMTPYENNSGFREVCLYIDVIHHLDVWLVNSGVRPLLLMHEIDTLFNNQHITELSINKIFADTDIIQKYSDYHWGYGMKYMLSNDSNLGCNGT